jgi:hypothetical protein
MAGSRRSTEVATLVIVYLRRRRIRYSRAPKPYHTGEADSRKCLSNLHLRVNLLITAVGVGLILTYGEEKFCFVPRFGGESRIQSQSAAYRDCKSSGSGDCILHVKCSAIEALQYPFMSSIVFLTRANADLIH